MQHRARAFYLGDRDVQARFSGRLPGPRQHTAALVDLDDLSRCQQSLVHAAARYGEPQRLTADDDAEVAAGAERPSAAVTETSDLGELRRELGGHGGHGGLSHGRSSNT